MKEYSFEEAIGALEELVKKLEGGQDTLEEAMADFESAVSLIKLCNDRLSAAEKKITVLTSEGEEVK